MAILALDIGGTFIKYAIYHQETNELAAVHRVPTPMESLEALLQQIEKIRSEQTTVVEGVAISMPGTIDSECGYVFQGGSLRYNDRLDFGQIAAQRLNCRVALENDARCAALAEMWQGNLVGIQNALVLVIGTGLGGAIVQNGELYKGTHLYAGELSMIMTKDFRTVGFDAVLGAQVGIPHFVETASAKIGEELDGPALFAKIEQGQNADLQADFAAYLDNFVRQIFNFQIMYDPEKILIGGGISQNQFFMTSLQNKLEDFYQQLPIRITHDPLGKCKFENNANLLGAVAHYLAKNQQSINC